MSIRSHEFLFLTILLNLLLGSSCVRTTPLSSPEGMLMEDKIRLGSTPPSCHNRCNTCNPCIAVQVPTLPGESNHDQLVHASSEEMPFSMYSNYKPLGWKCRCRDQLFNP
ncbi:EPIDERMAL PATTERNING FACTOR-like protein [Rhynchospora pubera]|uniref:Epidermal patterning factor-like protein n=1 Tax=Rhynchospora pubera TaxID=906938 RepID=A0AAV8H0H1_9POAL|nr:EPIDERMAL PATTERNING FACTOR-like protein [Rhynchospora pubera]